MAGDSDAARADYDCGTAHGRPAYEERGESELSLAQTIRPLTDDTTHHLVPHLVLARRPTSYL